MAYDVFLSYSRRDSPMFERVRDTLCAVGLIVWTDENLKPGTPSWKNAIEKAIEQASCLVVLLSPDSKDSVWVERELEYASSHNIPIFPLLIRGTEKTAVPFELGNIQRADIRHDYAGGMRALVTGIGQQLAIPNLIQRIDKATRPIQHVSRGAKWRPPRLALWILLLLMVCGASAFRWWYEGNLPNTALAAQDDEAASLAAVILIYDVESLTLVNQTGENVNVSGLNFVQTVSLFSSDEWADSSRAVYALAVGDCLQVWQREAGFYPAPSFCRYRQAWRSLSSGHIFWREAFDVWSSGMLVATCPAAVNFQQMCVLRLRP